MYRRNISHILYPLACLLGLFIVYQAWIKPAYLPTPPPDQPDAGRGRLTGHAAGAAVTMARRNRNLNRLA